MILGRLARRPMHGYMIAKIIGNVIGPFRQIHWGALYPVLARLEEAGLIRAEVSDLEEGGRAKKTYAITDAGRNRLHQHLMDTEHHLADYAEVFAQKVSLFDQLSPVERLQLARHYAVYAQQHIDHIERTKRELLAIDDPAVIQSRDNILTVLHHRLEYWVRERAWAEELLEQHQIKEAPSHV
jgi:DNA-binding PadR family transcriptional regulator